LLIKSLFSITSKQQILNNQVSFDFILTVYQTYVLCFVRDTYFKCYIKKEGKNDLEAIHSAIVTVISNAEKRLNKVFGSGILFVDFNPVNKLIIKVPVKEIIDLNQLHFKLEGKMNEKIFILKKLEQNLEYGKIMIVSSSKNIINKIVEIINFEEIEILKAKTVFEILHYYISKINDYKEYNIIKLSAKYCEFSYFKNNLLINHKVIKEHGIENILKKLSETFGISISELKVILEHYQFISHTDRMQKYYEREELDFKLKDFIESTQLISSVKNELKKYLLAIKSDATALNSLTFDVKSYFFCEPEFENLNLLAFNNSKDQLINLTTLNLFVFANFNSKNSLFNKLLNKIFLFFRLNS
jgi:hypothetical protein